MDLFGSDVVNRAVTGENGSFAGQFPSETETSKYRSRSTELDAI